MLHQIKENLNSPPIPTYKIYLFYLFEHIGNKGAPNYVCATEVVIIKFVCGLGDCPGAQNKAEGHSSNFWPRGLVHKAITQR